MTDPIRRQLVAGTGVALTGLVAGCLGDTSDAASDLIGGDSDGTSGETGQNGDDDGNDDGDSDDEFPITEDPRVDRPPHDPAKPEQPDEPSDEWNDHYLGEGMDDDSPLEFTIVAPVRFEEPGFDHGDGDSDSDSDSEPVFSVHLLDSADALEDTIDLEATDDEARAELESVAFDEQVVVVVQSGYGSSSVSHQWVRAVGTVDDETDSLGIQLHGYNTRPHVQTSDYTTRESVLVVDRPEADEEFDGFGGDELEFARVSHTRRTDQRVHYNSTEGTVVVRADGEEN